MRLIKTLKWWDVLFSASHDPHINKINHGKTLWKFPCAGKGIKFTMVQTNLKFSLL